jgi:hypothetical protein
LAATADWVVLMAAVDACCCIWQSWEGWECSCIMLLLLLLLMLLAVLLLVSGVLCCYWCF